MMRALPFALVSTLLVPPALASDYTDYDGKSDSAGVTYLERVTPAGTVPPPVMSQNAAGNLPVQEQHYLADPDEARAKRDHGRYAPAALDAVTAKFKQAYQAQDRPRMAVFMNRGLSDDVREWNTEGRVVISGKAAGQGQSDGQPWNYAQEADVAISAQTANPNSGARNNTSERWMWEFEDGFLESYLAAGARMIDRATIVRLAAAGRLDDTGAKRIETEALLNHADVYIEIQVVRSAASPYGYEFKASAKDVKSGMILANVTSFRWDEEERHRTEIEATNRGYQIRKELPPVHEVSADLAHDLMVALTRTWSGATN